MAAAYLFLNFNYILVCEIFFPNDVNTPNLLYESAQINHYGKFRALYKLILIV